MKQSAGFFIALGGSLGAALRFGLFECSLFSLYWDTVAVNVLGCLIIACLAVKRDNLSDNMQGFAMTGFCGALTTFSLFSLELLDLLKDQQWLDALIYLAITFGISIPLVFSIVTLTRRSR